ncbi:MAG: hypothetical protein HFI66_00905 [Lachnospiraceae bacterium]|jgi:hypothetical protein|nr:hypothetical protein [Lachnospiraceae bacterium]
MRLSDVRDHIDSLGLAEHVYMGKLDAKQEKSFGVYNSRHSRAYQVAIGGPELESYGTKRVTILVHWNRSLWETEAVTELLFDALRRTREEKVNEETIKFVQLLYEPQDVGTDDAGVCEMVIEAAFIYAKKGGKA